MIEKVNPAHPDKIADRIAGAIVDESYKLSKRPSVAVEIMIGHGSVFIINETTETISPEKVNNIVKRIAGSGLSVKYIEVEQDKYLLENQSKKARCGDNGIFKGVPLNDEELMISRIARCLYQSYPYDGKYILDGDRLIICQSNVLKEILENKHDFDDFNIVVNPLGYWTGGVSVDTGAVNRKLGSDMGRSVTGGGLHGKDLSKADVSVNIYAFLKAQATNTVQEFSCAIGDESIDGKSYSEIIEIAQGFIESVGGFEKFAEWGLF